MIKINPGAFSMPCYPPIYPDDLMERVGTTMAPPPPPVIRFMAAGDDGLTGH